MTVSQSQPRVSIGLPVYNGQAFLAHAIESVLGQSFADLELIVSDNGSTDRTRAIAEQYAARDARVRYVRSETNQGAAWNYRRAFDLARGEYFRWAPADDWFAPDSVAVCVAALDANPDAVLCYPKTSLVDKSGEVIRAYDDRLDLRSSDPAERFRLALAQIGLVNVIYGLVRTSALGKTRLMGSFVGADEVLVFELALQGKFLELPQSAFYRRIHEKAFSQMTATADKQAFFDPQTRGRFYLYLWQHYRQCLLGIAHAPVSLVTKVRAAAVLLRTAVSVRRRLWSEAVTGARRLLGPKAW
ncbi:MAG TPA: glycosyltransferase family 2 protein [Candidatus Krumholzibacteria bacterium]|nr:glycosyltransferase family 2 protein [Candidatus Krumholzibacteria bacterium]